MLFWLLRLLRALTVILAVTALAAGITLLLPGDPVLTLLGYESTEAQREELRETLGLNLGYWERFGSILAGLAVGDLGTSFQSGRPVMSEILNRLPATLQLILSAQVLAVVIAVPVALYGAKKQGGAFDRITSGASFLLLALPGFVVGIVLIYGLAVVTKLLPASGYTAFVDDPVQNLRYMVLPVLTLALAEAAVYTRTLRGAAIESLDEPFADAAIIRGASNARLLWRRILRPSLPPLITIVGLNIGVALGGTLLIESLFAVPGIGRLAISAIESRDIPLIQGIAILAAIGVVVMSIVIDLILTRVDPRSRHAH
ncbi:ABC transporter permease [Humidisolicoccus flavus]|uniref:ABC transporter permease n=1 Tax=Humidisolicoccus flavus TaxID=3111414 RepID=UPI0032556472